MADPSRQDALTVARIVRVNHAGEFGAIRIYSAQILVARRLWPDCVPSLSEMLGHERTHCAAFRAAMPARRSRPCRVMQFWSWGGWVLGFVTALLGPQGIWACTAAVEAAVHRHLDDQLFFLANRDHDLHGIILAIREEELAHLHHAEEQLKSPGPALNFLRSLISIATDVLIWLSTWGDSSRMTRALKAAKRTS
ncbi:MULTISPECIES: demethoxyubiquinone hydroxylase family protein [unclassified Mesorhizobium]|jgi:ubiquinone biosynthesis monooxygenase Coq7|uniref:demethoxyubiquinone hydroxylase family protein n=1 Tax=unclassified Mesorhizobium TaxID=325217 RepID=UPI0003CE4E75|nr:MULTISPECIES: demethoxyubiquinone hydroxylase family protein [unclassified Mesorhizobium]ESY14003.1 ubiquinone biosynthesis protein UbiB [Mesorhizobium sp. LNJC395A00]ESZ43254.1 ubiquinone biosynthesis protein UbiB [Mesorhizobium sp. L103C565B0]ESZ70271.1 ubiquinone biosynthesis protein UbiB [Mesorhizobium sp. L103C119B0]WJI76423.1 demethoxyubiquinone hydroxylase family protein [Mesorhizobium sp. C395A]